MGRDNTQVFPLGPGGLVFNSIDLGNSDEAGFTLTRKVTEVKATVGKTGKSPVAIFYAGEEVTLEGVLMQNDMTILGNAFPLANIITNAGGSKRLTFGNTAGTQVPAQSLVLSSLISANDPAWQLNMKAVPSGDFSPVWTGGKLTGYKVKFECVIDTGKTEGAFMFSFGDPSITADAVAPAVSAVSPVDGGSGSAGSTVVWTISKPLDASTVGVQSVMLLKGATGLGSRVAGSVALVNNGASTTITFTPTSSLASATYYAVLNPDVIKGQNAVALDPTKAESEFTV